MWYSLPNWTFSTLIFFILLSTNSDENYSKKINSGYLGHEGYTCFAIFSCQAFPVQFLNHEIHLLLSPV